MGGLTRAFGCSRHDSQCEPARFYTPNTILVSDPDIRVLQSPRKLEGAVGRQTLVQPERNFSALQKLSRFLLLLPSRLSKPRVLSNLCSRLIRKGSCESGVLGPLVGSQESWDESFREMTLIGTVSHALKCNL